MPSDFLSTLASELLQAQQILQGTTVSIYGVISVQLTTCTRPLGQWYQVFQPRRKPLIYCIGTHHNYLHSMIQSDFDSACGTDYTYVMTHNLT